MSKQKELLAREAIETLKLRAAIQSTNYEVVGEYGRSNDSGQGDQKLWLQLKAEEQQEQKQARKNQPAFKILSAQWSKPIAELIRTAGMLLPDVGAELPMTDKLIVGDVQKTLDNLVDLQKSRCVVYSRDGLNRLISYTGCAARCSQVIDGVSYHPALDTLDCWLAADRRLVELGAYGENERAELLVDEQPQRVEQSAEDLKAAAEQEWSKFPLWHAWEKSLESGFGIKLTDSYRRIVCGEFERANLSPYAADSYNEIRRRLVARERFPTRPDGEPALTLDERMALAVDNYNFNDPRQKAAYCHEMGRLRAILGE